MRLSELAADYEIRPAPGASADPEIRGLCEDSRRIERDMLFVAISGTADDGRRYVRDAVERGAAAVAAEAMDPDIGVPFVRVPSARAALAAMAARFFGHPARQLRLIGFTGTFGKTSTSAILRELLDAGGASTGVLGSLGAKYGAFHDPGNGLTTPAPVELHRALRGLEEAGADTVVMEVTSHALRLGRVEGLTFRGGLLSAIESGEHTDFHGSYDDYVDAKRQLLRYLARDALLAYDADNDAARGLAAEARVARRSGFSLEGRDAEVRLKDVTLDHEGAHFTLDGVRFDSPLLGRGHLKNVALALAYATAAGVALEIAREVVSGLAPLPRRMERYGVDGRLVLDDTAGHPDSLAATFDVASMLAPGSRTVVVYAVRGNRGVDINRRNARALADLASSHGVNTIVATASADVAGPHDRASAEEVDAAREEFARGGREVVWRDALADAAAAALDGTRPGDLIVLVGAQGMNEGRRLLVGQG